MAIAIGCSSRPSRRLGLKAVWHHEARNVAEMPHTDPELPALLRARDLRWDPLDEPLAFREKPRKAF